MLCSRLGSKREGKKEKNGKVFKWSSIHYVFWAFESAKWRAHSSWWKNRHRICNSKKKDEREKFEWKILRETEKKLKTDEMKANDNRFLACIHIHCSNVERESVEISEHQPINMAWALIFFPRKLSVCVCASSVWYFNRLLNVHSKAIAFITTTRAVPQFTSFSPTIPSTNHSSYILKKYQFYMSETRERIFTFSR